MQESFWIRLQITEHCYHEETCTARYSVTTRCRTLRMRSGLFRTARNQFELR